MKKRKLPIYVVVISLFLAGFLTVFWQSAYTKDVKLQIKVQETVLKDDEVTVRLEMNSDIDIYSLTAYLNYDAKKLMFVPEREEISGSDGVLEIRDVYTAGEKNVVYDVKFKALSLGEADIALTDVCVTDYKDMAYMELAPSSEIINIERNPDRETDARLSKLLVSPGKWNPPFSPDCYEYEVLVDSDTEQVGIGTVPMKEDSVVTMERPETLQMGKNKFRITVTSVSGTVCVYTVYVIRGS